MMKKLLHFFNALLILLTAAFFTSCFNVTQTYSLNPDGTFYATACISFNKDTLEYFDITPQEFINSMSSEEDCSVKADEENIYLFLEETLTSDDPEAPVISDDKIFIYLNDDQMDMLGADVSTLDDPEFQEFMDLMNEETSWTFNIDKSLTRTVSRARLTDYDGNGIELKIKNEGDMFVISFPTISLFNSDYQFEKLELYK